MLDLNPTLFGCAGLTIFGVILIATPILSWLINRKKIQQEISAAVTPRLKAERMAELENLLSWVDKELIVPRNEKESDYIALAHLMPLNQVVSFLDECNYENVAKRRRVKAVKRMVKTFGVQDVYVLRRIREVRMLMAVRSA